jgi:hypothetical protein
MGVKLKGSGDYHSDCPLDRVWLDFAGINTRPSENSSPPVRTTPPFPNGCPKRRSKNSRSEVIAWNNRMRDKAISKMPMRLQEFLEDYIPANLPTNKIVRVWFDVYDIEEKRI